MNRLLHMLSSLDLMPAAHVALGLLLITTIVAGVGLAATQLFGNGTVWRSYALRCLMAALIASITCDLLVQAVWSPEQRWPAPVTITTTVTAAQPIVALMHPEMVPSQEPSVQILTPSDRISGHVRALPNASGMPSTIRMSIMQIVDYAVFSGWLLVAMAILIRQLAGQIAVGRICRRAVPISDVTVLSDFKALCERAGLRDQGVLATKLVESEWVDCPFVTGFLNYTIVLPASLVRFDGDHTALRAAISHELAHVRRADPLFSLLAQLACAVCWFQPLVWHLARLMQSAAEEAADADVLAADGSSAPQYAELLYTIAKSRTNRLTEAVAGVGMMPNRSALARRVELILNGAVVRPVNSLQRVSLAAVLAGALVVTFICCLLRYSPDSTATLQATTASSQQASAVYISSWHASANYINQFGYAAQRGWQVAGVQGLQGPPPISAVSDAQYAAISDGDAKLIKQLASLSYARTVYGGPSGPPESDRATVESILAAHPHFFYAEYMLAAWYDKWHQVGPATEWMERALDDAPQIVAGQVTFSNGKPIPGYQFGTALSYPYRGASSPEGSVRMDFPLLHTDQNGCYYLPSFKGIAGQWDWSTGSPADHRSPQAKQAAKMAVNQLGPLFWAFSCDSRVAVVPPYIAQDYLPLKIGSQEIDGSTSFSSVGGFEKPFVVQDGHVRLTWGSAKGATKYYVNMTETIDGPNKSKMTRSITDDNPLFKNGQTSTTLTLDESAHNPGFKRRREYEVDIAARDSNYGLVSRSATGYFVWQ